MFFIFKLTKYFPEKVQKKWRETDPSVSKRGYFYEGTSKEDPLTCSLCFYSICIFERLIMLLFIFLIYMLSLGVLPLEV